MPVSANLPNDRVKPALSSHLMVVTRSNVFLTIIKKMFIANSIVLIFYCCSHLFRLSIALTASLVTGTSG